MKAHLPLPPSHHNKSKQALETWKKLAEPKIKSLRIPSGKLEIVLDFWGPFEREDGTEDPKMPDTKNLIWKTEDFIAKVLGYNDRRHWRIVATRHDSKRERMTVEIRKWRG